MKALFIRIRFDNVKIILAKDEGNIGNIFLSKHKVSPSDENGIDSCDIFNQTLFHISGDGSCFESIELFYVAGQYNR